MTRQFIYTQGRETTMGFTKAQQERVLLREYAGQPVALRFISDEENIPVNYPDGTSEVRGATLARVASVKSGGAQVDGDTLVFYKVVADQVRGSAPDWIVGMLEEVETGRTAPDGTEQTYFQITNLDEGNHEAFVSALQSAGIG